MVRNKLRERFVWDDVTLDQAWVGLIEDAARRYVEGGGYRRADDGENG